MTEQLVELNVITIDEVDIFGNYLEDELFDAMKELFVSLKDEIDKHYTIDEQLEYHYDELIKLYEILQKPQVDLSNLKQFLNIYNDLTPNHYEVNTIEIDPSDEALINRYISKYGFKNYQTNFQKLKLEFYKDEQATKLVELKPHEIEDFIINLLIEETEFIRANYTGAELIEWKLDYLSELKKQKNALDNGVLELIVLEQLLDQYNCENECLNKRIEIVK
ncbi:hypothetical protein NFD59_11790 (plasmid) [Staphylococcus epidermidis]|uniref:hypothetical protein n=1 Tax=Staphylococcus epidermidis TaxID=1282 RepID=UPI00193B93E4|nr:hypothetical protein [Staphylococcus epidermidis]MBM6202936.1 hypothetical protein [Staphylococcus epidermidis]MBM6210021.1 hypothetical protein [Staphylococcus epidermidis]MCG8955700.1 hypothetical protein [Staphylococcus epidermidis]MCO6301923.1 hypothetical protein [Staphylococcus epidermidis]QRJ00957.1 hypothetical protein HJI11_12340 [Staphylococcus epidermidis]